VFDTFKNRGELDIFVRGDKQLFNQYVAILVNPAKHLHVKADLGESVIDWLISREGKNAIAGYKVESQQLLVPNGYLSRT
jgi:tungstate transport system substrate-binding protein